MRMRDRNSGNVSIIMSVYTGADGTFPITLPPSPLPPAPLPSAQSNSDTSDNSELTSWFLKLETLKSDLTNQISELQRSLYLQERHLKQATPEVKSLMRVVRESPGQAADVLSAHMGKTLSVQSYCQRGVVRCGGEGGRCEGKALPFSRFCLKREFESHCNRSLSTYGITAHAVGPNCSGLYEEDEVEHINCSQS